MLASASRVNLDGRRMRIDELPVTEWDRVMAVNATGAFLGIKHVVGPMRRAGGGSIVNMSSAAGIVGTHAAAYSASKGAVRLLTKAAALELATDNIRCNSVHPGVIETPITAELRGDPDARARAIEAHPLGRFGQPAEVARGCLYLACEDSSFVTGSELVIDGGRTAQ
jgi:NAD(P)-dependent dehydrogenase (short-subunit alcohol dehydrogenase family)